jgi:hypothetical protein
MYGEEEGGNERYSPVFEKLQDQEIYQQCIEDVPYDIFQVVILRVQAPEVLIDHE